MGEVEVGELGPEFFVRSSAALTTLAGKMKQFYESLPPGLLVWDYHRQEETWVHRRTREGKPRLHKHHWRRRRA